MKAQVSIEFMTYVFIMMLMVTLAAYVAVTSSRGITDDNKATDAHKVAAVVAEEINIAVEVGDGYSHTFTLPYYLFARTDYSVNVSENRFVTVIWNTRSFSLPVYAENVTAVFGIQRGDNTIRNVNGVIQFG